MPVMQRLQAGWGRWQARGWLLLGRRARALACIDRRLRTHPEDPHALATQAHLLAQAGDRQGAIAAQWRLVRADPGRAAAWFNLGFLLEGDGQVEEAEAAFRNATVIDARMDRAWYGLALCLIRLRRFDGAVEALRRNTELQPMSPYGWYQLARVHLDQDEPAEAARILQHLRRFDPRVAAQLERETGLGAAAT